MGNITQLQPAKTESRGLMASKEWEIWLERLSQTSLTTIRQSIELGAPQIGFLSADDPITTKAVITLEIENVLDFLNIGKSMSDSQIATTIEIILVSYPELTLSDIQLFFMWLKTGAYGKFYDRIDGNIILEALEKYNLSKIEEKENIHNEQKHSSIGGFHPSVIKAMNQAIDDYRVEKAKEVKQSKPRELTYAEIFHKRALRQFDNLFLKYGVNIGIRALKIGKNHFTIDTFIQQKVNNAIKSNNNY